MKILSIVAIAMIASGCGKSTTGPLCTQVLAKSLSITVVDSVTGTLLANSVLKATLGSRTDSVAIGSNVAAYPVSLAWGAGTFSVTVTAPGYASWNRSATVTSHDPTCGALDPLAIAALMQKSP